MRVTQETDRMSSVRDALDFEQIPFNLPWRTSAESGAHEIGETPRAEYEPMDDEIRGHGTAENAENGVFT
jgi:hypothetical protein